CPASSCRFLQLIGTGSACPPIWRHASAGVWIGIRSSHARQGKSLEFRAVLLTVLLANTAQVAACRGEDLSCAVPDPGGQDGRVAAHVHRLGFDEHRLADKRDRTVKREVEHE